MRTCLYKLDEWKAGFFHQWSISYDEFESGPGQFAAAIVEDAEGRVHVIFAGDVDFSPDNEEACEPVMKVLVWSEKHGDVIVAARTSKEEAFAWLYLFKLMDGMGYYGDLKGDEIAAYQGAAMGGLRAAKRLLELRSGYEYEQVSVEEVMIP